MSKLTSKLRDMNPEAPRVSIINPRAGRLKELEQVIERHLDGWIHVGTALLEIREDKLYRETHPTLEAWAAERFNFSRRRAYQMMDAVKIRGELENHGTQILPANERQARVLANTAPESRAEVWGAAVALAGDEELTEKHVKAAVREMHRQAQVSKLVEISKGNKAIKGVGRHPILLADPPWQYDGGTADPTRQIENQYPTMTVEAICDLPVEEELALDDAVLFLWATAPLLPDALTVMDAWGFAYKTGAVWDKCLKGMGYWFRGQHEHLLVGVRGNPPKPAPKSLSSSVIVMKRGGHSEKPALVHEMIDAYYPELPKLEMFARGERPGGQWTTWGNQS